MDLWLSVIPPISAIIFAIWTKQVIPSLLIGLWIGSFILTQSFFGSFFKTVDYITGVLTTSGNIHVVLFLYIFSGLVALIQVSGGIQAFAKFVGKYIDSSQKTFAALWALLPVTFVDCGFRVVATGAIIKPLAEKYNIAKERLAYMLNNSSSPVILLIPIATTFVGYIIGVVQNGMDTTGIEGSAFSFYLQSLPYQFFSFFSILIALTTIMPKLNLGPMKELIRNHSSKKADLQTEFAEDMSHQHKAETSKDQTGNAMKGNMEHNHDMDQEPSLKPKLINLLIPLLTLIPLSFFLMIGSEESSKAMLVALILTLIVTFLLYLVQGLKLAEQVDNFIKGGNKLIVTIGILIVAWPISTVSQDLGLTTLIENTLSNTISATFVPVITFVVTAAVSYFIGSSWGSWALMMPVAFTLAVATGSSIPIIVAAVLSGGTFGDVTSPVSGMTAMSAGIAEADHMKYVKAMSPYNLGAGVLAASAFFLVPILF
ncbi:Na+/H+ antiporter NhaC family protein [Virgibacillus litoralis]|uniref:Na+/H+ antiporter NhaC n=1 Tax=Virgibacillus litoralis TaxID=578221 RepID=A0ABS4HH89_9BACI|nr:Na+/H+ antiporter NhaC family protein [Virgibacillus litoralis]MBP1949964.1 Na+/H+ antiporter NhaC [Virgibacillus litoralis]